MDTSAEAWMSVTKAAEALTALGDRVSYSPISRYINKYDIPKRKEGRETLVDFNALRKSRLDRGHGEDPPTAQVNAPVPNSMPGLDFTQIERESPVLPVSFNETPADPAKLASLSDRQRLERIKADKAEAEFEAYRGGLVDLSSVESAISVASNLFDQVFESQITARAEEYAVITDEAVLKKHLKAAARKLKETFALSLAQAAEMDKEAA